MQQQKWHQQEIQAIGIQITPTSRTLPALGSYVGATSALVRTRALSSSVISMVVRPASTRFGFLSVLWTDEVSDDDLFRPFPLNCV